MSLLEEIETIRKEMETRRAASEQNLFNALLTAGIPVVPCDLMDKPTMFVPPSMYKRMTNGTPSLPEPSLT